MKRESHKMLALDVKKIPSSNTINCSISMFLSGDRVVCLNLRSNATDDGNEVSPFHSVLSIY